MLAGAGIDRYSAHSIKAVLCSCCRLMVVPVCIVAANETELILEQVGVAATLCTYLRAVLRLNLGRGIALFPAVSPAKCRHSTLK